MTRNRRAFIRQASFVGVGLLGATSSASAASDSSDGGHLEGTVTHFGSPVEDATVVAGDEHETETNERGSYALDIDAGEYDLEVSADGYTTETRTVDVSAAEATTVDVSLDREWGPETGDLEVFVTEVGGGSTIPCDVTIYGDETFHTHAPRGSVPDDVNWQRGFVVNEGWWEIRVSNAEGYDDGYQEVYVEAGDDAVGWVELTEGDNVIPETGRVEGTVTDEGGTAVDGATVFVDDLPTAVTDENGAFDLDLEHGIHVIETEANGYDSVSGEVQVKFGRTTELNIALGPESASPTDD